ncbi:MAG: hypothetical protein FJX76_22675 [Armatimonadetes bacterium]|nr:hypothetical protein [Armatimonadota bacterium]
MKTSKRRRSEDATGLVQAALEQVLPGTELPDDARIFYRWLDERYVHASQLEQSEPTRYLLEDLERRGERLAEALDQLHKIQERLLEREVQLARVEGELAHRDRTTRALEQDLTELQSRYRTALQVTGESRRLKRELENELKALEARLSHVSVANDELNAHVEYLSGLLTEADAAPEAQPPVDVPGSPAQPPISASLEPGLSPHAAHLLEVLDAAEARLAASDAIHTEETMRYREIFAAQDNHVRNLECALGERDRRIEDLERMLAGWLVRKAMRVTQVVRRRSSRA